MRQAITTKFHGPTDTRGSRVSASAEAGKITLSWDHRLNSSDNHTAAAQALARKLGWSGSWFGGGLGVAYVFVQGDGPSGTLPVFKIASEVKE